MNKVFECSQLLTSVAMVLPLSMLQSKGYDIVILRAYRLLLYISILLQKMKIGEIFVIAKHTLQIHITELM